MPDLNGRGRAVAGWATGFLFFAVLALAGLVLDGFLLSLFTIVFIFAFLGSAWNIMLGIAGQLSIGHALFIGIGAYSVAVLSIRYGVTPWIGLLVGIALSALAGAIIACLSFRFEVKGIYFALLTIAFAEFGRIVASGWSFVGGMAGQFYPALQPGGGSLWALRGDAQFFYFVALALAVLGVVITVAIRQSALGYLWRAMRDDEDAARALGVRTFRHKIVATMLSAGMTALGGGVFGLIQGSVFPDSMMGMHMSVEILIGPIVGGLGTAFGPFVGAIVIIPLTHTLTAIGDSIGLPGLNSITYGIILIAVVWLLPDGIWPGVSKSFSRLFGRRSRKEAAR